MKTIFLVAVLTMASTCHAGWDYAANTDQITGRKIVEAQVSSENSLSFGFPYQGENRGLLVVLQHPKYGLEVIIAINKGQMLCRSYDCAVSVKFDDGKPVTYGGNGPADHSSTSVFLNNPARFIAGAKKAKKILVQFNAFHNGAPVLEFSTPTSLDWPRK